MNQRILRPDEGAKIGERIPHLSKTEAFAVFHINGREFCHIAESAAK